MADRIVAFEGIPQRVDLGMTVRAGLDRAVFLQLLADGGGAADIGLDGRDVGGWRAGRRTEELLEHPDTALHGRGLHAVGGDGEHAGLAEESASRRIRGQLDAAELIATHGGQVVESGESGVHVGEVSVDERRDRLVGAEQFADETAGFLPHHRFQPVDMVGGEGFLGGRHGPELVQAEPLLREEAEEAFTATRIQQAVGFASDGLGIELIVRRQRPECLIGRTGGEEVRESSRQLRRRDDLGRRFRLSQEQELRGAEQSLEHRSGGVGVARLAVESLLEGLHVRLDVFGLHVAAEESAGEALQLGPESGRVDLGFFGIDAGEEHRPRGVGLVVPDWSGDLPGTHADHRSLVEMLVKRITLGAQGEIFPDVLGDLRDAGVVFVELGGDEVPLRTLRRAVDPGEVGHRAAIQPDAGADGHVAIVGQFGGIDDVRRDEPPAVAFQSFDLPADTELHG